MIHGQGTACMELLEDEPEVRVVATPVGGGGLLSGTAISAKSHDPSIRVVGVEPAQADDAYRSWKTGSIQVLAAAPDTMADGVRTMSIGARTFDAMFAHRLVDEIVTVTEQEIASAVRVAWSRIHLALEPTAALPLAAYLTGKLPAGRTGLVSHVQRHNILAQYMASLVDDIPQLELMAPVELSIVCFRYVPDSLRGDEEQLDTLNKRIMEEVQGSGNAFVNGTILHGRFVLRSCALHFALTEDDVVAIIEEVCQVGERCLA